MNEQLIKQLDAEITTTQRQLAALQAARAALSGGKTASVSPAAPTARLRAPTGALEQAIKDALKSGRAANGEVRARLKKAGYGFSVTPLHVGKTLSRMVAEKELRVAKIEKGRQLYEIVK